MNIIMVHGIWDTGSVYHRMATYLRRQGHTCLHPDMDPKNGANGLRDLAEKLKVLIDQNFGTDEPIVIIGFSMGTIISREYMQQLGGAARTTHFFSISGPHRGTLTAHLWLGKAARDMRFGSKLLTELNKDFSVFEGITVHSYRTPLDLLILPSISSKLHWAVENHTIPALYHHQMVAHKKVIQHIAAVLSESAENQSDAARS